MSFRIRLIQFLLQLNDRVFLYPKLAAYYKTEITDQEQVIIDVGANRGQTISFFLNVFPKAVIYAFEPNKKVFEIAVNRFKQFPSIKLYNKGISNKNGKHVFYESILSETSTLEELNINSNYLSAKAKILGVKPTGVIARNYEIDVITINSFLAGVQQTKIHILKIDTEGHEYKCLQGVFSNYKISIDYIQLEYHHDDMYLNKTDYNNIQGILKQHNFVLHKRIKHRFGEIEELLFKRIN
ncbi:MAG: FkbM family methyltransferase [Lacibacter sp.]|nr:FkbM family methyltransferase [Lacibacter sp.]